MRDGEVTNDERTMRSYSVTFVSLLLATHAARALNIAVNVRAPTRSHCRWQGTHSVLSLHRRSRDRRLDQPRSFPSRSQRRTPPTPTHTPGWLTRTKSDVSPRSSVWSTSRTSTSSTSLGSTCQHRRIHVRAVVRRLNSSIGTHSFVLSSSPAGSGSCSRDGNYGD